MFTVWETPYVQTEAKGILSCCLFCNFTSKNAAISIESVSYSLEVRMTMFDMLICDDTLPFCFIKGVKCELESCCFFQTSGTDAPGVGIYAHSENVPYSSANRTVECKCGLGRSLSSSFFGGRKGITFFHNNFTSSWITTKRSSFSLETSPFTEDVTGFVQVTNCRGGPIFSLYLDRDSLFEKMNFINSTLNRNSGCICIVYSYTATIRDFIIEVKDQRNWIEPDSRGDPSLLVISCQIMGCKPSDSLKVVESELSIVGTVVLPFIMKNAWFLCGQRSGRLTVPLDSYSTLPILLILSTMIP